MQFSEEEKAAVYRAIKERRDMRHFKNDPIPKEILAKLLEVARQAPSVGYMQPWRFVRITSDETRGQLYDLVSAEITKTAEHVGEKKEAYMKLKLEGIRECSEVWVASLMGGREQYVLGRRTIPEMDLASLSCAIQNIWLAARAENIGVGWVSFFQPEDLVELLNMPNDAFPVAILCMGYVENFYKEPLLKTQGWDKEREISEIFFEDTWGESSSLFDGD